MRLHRFWRKLLCRSRRGQLDRELAEEIEFHRHLKEQENLQAGLEREDAVDRAHKQMGNLTLAKEEARGLWSFPLLENLLQDIRYAARMFRRIPGFTVIAVISLALGIGGNVAMFTLVDTLLIRPLPFAQPNRLVRITGIYPRAALPVFQQHSHALEVALAGSASELNLTGAGEPIRVLGSIASPNLFRLLGLPVERGRDFQPGEDLPGRDGVVILSDSLWRSKFGGNPKVIGRTIKLNGVNRQIVGVMPPHFGYPSSEVQLWIPARLDASDMVQYWGGDFVTLIARLRPGATLAQARNEVPSIVSRIRRMFPYPMSRDWNPNPTVISLRQDLTGNVRLRLIILFASVGLVLLIACANVANLLLSRATTRRREIALRAALGAGRLRIIRQLLTESILLAFVGTGLGTLLGIAALSVFKTLLPPGIPGLMRAGLDWHVAAFAAGLAILTGAAFGLAPAWSASQIDLAGAMKTGSQRSTATKWIALRSWLIAGEVALTLLLLVSAGLLMKSLYTLSDGNPGFDPNGILTLRISPNQSLCTERSACIALYDRILERARGTRGVSQAVVANTVPLASELPMIPVDVEGHPKSADFPAPMFWIGAISPGYLHLMKIPLIAGRSFTQADGAHAPHVVLITPATARRYWPGQDPIGKHIKWVGETQWRTVVGVVRGVRQYSLAANLPDWVGGAMYMPYAQAVQGDQQIPAAMNLLVKVRNDSGRLPSELRELARDQAPNAPVGAVQSLTGIMSASIGTFRSTIDIFVGFAAAAILLAIVGIYGLVSYWVTQRTYEIGLRMAIGATRGNIVSMVLKQGLRIALYGIAAGFVAALLLTRFLVSLLYGVKATDPITFAIVIALMLGAVGLATAIPAWKASQIDPVRSLRVE
ncbi:MAG: ADOP family duplicated permease [Bryobacteraceae bacterium]